MLVSHISKKNPREIKPLVLAKPPPETAVATTPVETAVATTPPGTPPETVVASSSEFKEGDTVKYLKDTRKDRVWTIDGVDDDDIIISTDDFSEGEEGWQIVTKDEIVRESGGLKIGETVELKPDTLPKNIVEEIPLANLQEKQRIEDKEQQKETTPTLTEISLTDKEKTSEKEGEPMSGGKKLLSL